MCRFSVIAISSLLLLLTLMDVGCARRGAGSARGNQFDSDRAKREGDVDASSSRKLPTRAEVPDNAPVPFDLRLTGARVPPPTELAKIAKRWRDENRKRGVKEPVKRAAEALQATYESPFVTKPARLQGNNDCWAFGTIEVMESAYLKASGSADLSIHFAPQAIVDCNPYQYTANDGGWWSFVVYEDGFLGRHGGPLAVNYPYVGYNQSCKAFTPPFYVLTARELIGDGGYADENDIKSAVLDKGAVGTAIYSDGKFYWWRPEYYNVDEVFTSRPNFHPDCPDPNNCPWHNHIVVITGWDDRRGAWHVRNSWGTGWGRDGYAWVRYGENAIGYSVAWAEMAPQPRP